MLHQQDSQKKRSEKKNSCADTFCFTILVAMHATISVVEELGIIGNFSGTLLHISVTACAVQCTFGCN